MKTIKIKYYSDIPENFTGIAEYPNGVKKWYKNGERHREDGPAVEYPDGEKQWFKEGKWHRLDGPAVEYSNGDKCCYIDNICYPQINLKDYIVLDYDKGEYGLMWYKLLDKDEIFEYPDIPGFTIK